MSGGETTRRTVLKTASGVVAGGVLAGCLNDEEEDDPNGEETENGEDEPEEEETDFEEEDEDEEVEAEGSATFSEDEATVRVTAREDFSGGDSLNEIRIEYTAADVSNVEEAEVTVVSNGDETDVTDDVDEVSDEDNGSTLVIGLGGSYNVEEGDQVVASYTDVQNAEEDEDVTVILNGQETTELTHGAT